MSPTNSHGIPLRALHGYTEHFEHTLANGQCYRHAHASISYSDSRLGARMVYTFRIIYVWVSTSSRKARGCGQTHTYLVRSNTKLRLQEGVQLRWIYFPTGYILTCIHRCIRSGRWLKIDA